MTVIHQIGSISITIFTDNSTDFLLTNSSHAIRQQLIKDEKFILLSKHWTYQHQSIGIQIEKNIRMAESPLIREQFDRDNPDKARNPKHLSLDE
jgi:hypothetical protein